MVDALSAVSRALRPGGIVIDVRPDVAREARILAGGPVRTRMLRGVDADHERADAAVDRVVQRGLFTRVSRGVLWYESRFRDLESLDAYFSGGEHSRGDRDGWHAQIAPYRREPLTLCRAAKFEVLARVR